MMFKCLHEKRSELINVVCVHEKYKERHNYVTLYGSVALLGGDMTYRNFSRHFNSLKLLSLRMSISFLIQKQHNSQLYIPHLNWRITAVQRN